VSATAEEADPVGDAIVRRRHALRLSMEDLAAKAGVGRSTVYRASVGRPVHPDVAQALSVALGWPPDAIHRMAAGEDPEAWVHARPSGEASGDADLRARVFELEERLRRLEGLLEQ